jgi:hypothetical protein
MEHSVVIRHRDTGLYVSTAAGCTGDVHRALHFPDRATALRFMSRHACERGEGLEVIDRAAPAAA